MSAQEKGFSQYFFKGVLVMKNIFILSYYILIVLAGCTATNKFKGPQYTLDDEHSSSAIVKTLINSEDYVLNQNCSEAHSIHSPIIWLPILGPTLDLLLVPSPSELSGNDAWSILPLFGPPITYIKGTQDCVYHSLTISHGTNKAQTALNDKIPADMVKEAITVSDKNCSAYQHIITGGFGELEANQKFLSDASTMTQTGAAFASPVAGAIVGGLKQAVTSANDAIKTSFFINFGAPQLFENISAVRHLMINELEPTDGKPSKYGYTPLDGMSYANLNRFMTAYDKTCFFEQAINDLNRTTDHGQAKLKNGEPKKEDSTQKVSKPEQVKNNAEPSSSETLQKILLIDNNLTPMQ